MIIPNKSTIEEEYVEVPYDREGVSSSEQDKVARDYEYHSATMQSQISLLMRELDDASERDRQLVESEARVFKQDVHPPL